MYLKQSNNPVQILNNITAWRIPDSKPDSMTDSEIIRQILQGNKEQYRLLVERYQTMIFRTCTGFVHNKEDADDLTQEVFIRAYQSLSRFKGDAAFSTWIYRIAVNASLNKIRKSSKSFLMRQLEMVSGKGKDPEPVLPVPVTENPETILIRKEYSEWVQKVLDSLPEKQRTAFVLSRYDDMPQKEIAAVMNTTEGAVEALIQRAKANLREKIIHIQKKTK